MRGYKMKSPPHSLSKVSIKFVLRGLILAMSTIRLIVERCKILDDLESTLGTHVQKCPQVHE